VMTHNIGPHLVHTTRECGLLLQAEQRGLSVPREPCENG